ncbi:MAG: metal-dependent hydrolase [Bacteroidota bacterium]|nr:metal-dependent hydrolase [Bacteroidota bacterium]
MASAFAHALVAVTVGKTFSQKFTGTKFFWLGIFCSVIPDADVVMHNWVEYDSFFGHRGFFHSFFFCAILAIFVRGTFYRHEQTFSKLGWMYIIYFFLCSASHAALDMLTNGGLGVAIFSPFCNERFFFDWHPVHVSPMSISHFFSGRAYAILASELKWIGIPCAIWMGLLVLIKMVKQKN